jgi:hypothetical protein
MNIFIVGAEFASIIKERREKDFMKDTDKDEVE